MKLINKIFICSCIMTAFSMTAGICEQLKCLEGLGTNGSFIDGFKELVNDPVLLKDKDKLPEYVSEHKHDFYKLIAPKVYGQCMTRNFGRDSVDAFNKIADSDTITIAFQIDNQKYDITINTTVLFQYMAEYMPTSVFWVINNISYTPGQIISTKGSSNPNTILYTIPNEWFYSKECSDHDIGYGISKKSPVSKAGQIAFGAYGGGSDNEYYLDFPGKRHGMRTFPGIVIGDFVSVGNYESIISYKNYKTAREALKKFAAALQGTACSDLAVYQVLVDKELPDVPVRTLWKSLPQLEELIIVSDPEIIYPK